MKAILSTTNTLVPAQNKECATLRQLEKMLIGKQSMLTSALSEIKLMFGSRNTPLYTKEQIAEVLVANAAYQNRDEAMKDMDGLVSFNWGEYKWEEVEDHKKGVKLYRLNRKLQDFGER